MERVMTVADVLANFDMLIRAVAEGQEAIIVEDDGKLQVAILSIAEYERLQPTRSDNWLERADKLREQIRLEPGDRTLPLPEDIIRKMREERGAQSLDNLRPFMK